MYLRQKPLYPFGYGLSYTTFRYSMLHLSSITLHSGGNVNVKVDVSNIGQRAGDEVVQLYVTHLNSKIERPIEQLDGFDRIHLAPGDTRTVSLTLSANSLRYWDDTASRWVLEPGQLEIRVGASSEDIRARQTIHVVP